MPSLHCALTKMLQQPSWNGVEFATPNSFGSYPQYPKEQPYYDSNAVPSSEQNAPSPVYSQFLNFDAAGPDASLTGTDNANAISSQQFFNPSSIPTDNTPQYADFAIKTEPGFEQNDPAFSCGLNLMQDNNMSPQSCGPVPACLQLLENPEMEDFNLPGSPLSPKLSNADGELMRIPSRISSGNGRPLRRASDDSVAKPRGRRARKSSSSDEEAAQARAKQAHSIVERRYRDNLNGKIMQLHRTLSAIGSPARIAGLSTDEPPSANDQRTRVRKSDVMTDAVNYVHQSEVSMRHMTDEIKRLSDRVRTLEKLVKCEDCALLKQMVRLQLHSQQNQQAQQAQQAQM
ncbi:Helix-loop-helix DNA-binding domain-containing protein isoform 1 [Cladophialophora immunda]|nr:Helix-loop-helix DNA-binding domain-containing protein isoform 1 [Cladophialophora immunda]